MKHRNTKLEVLIDSVQDEFEKIFFYNDSDVQGAGKKYYGSQVDLECGDVFPIDYPDDAPGNPSFCILLSKACILNGISTKENGNPETFHFFWIPN